MKKMRLIDADALERDLFDADWMLDNDEHMVDDILRKQPTIDAVNVVRCKDCKFWTPSGVFGKYAIGGVYEYGRCLYLSETKECFYCTYGQKRISKEETTK